MVDIVDKINEVSDNANTSYEMIKANYHQEQSNAPALHKAVHHGGSEPIIRSNSFTGAQFNYMSGKPELPKINNNLDNEFKIPDLNDEKNHSYVSESNSNGLKI